MKKFGMMILGFLILSLNVMAQEGPVLKFEVTHHEFGKIKEEGGAAVFTYKFVNTGNQPLKIERVQAACGCTTPDWSREEIKPGKEGFVKTSFDPMGRPGNFSKSVTVYANTNPNMTLLTFSGEVLARARTIEDSFPSVVGNLRFVLNHVNFGRLTTNIKDTSAEITLYNVGRKPMTVKSLRGPAYISAKLPIVLPVRKEVKLRIHYNATLLNDYGLIFEQMKLITDDDQDPEKNVSVIADVHPFVPKLTDAEATKAPKIEFDRKAHEFGDIKQGDDVVTNFKFTNTGKQELKILKVKSTCGCTAPEPQKTSLQPGESSDIKVTYYSAGKHGKDQKNITVITNDPANPEIILSISSNVLVPPAGVKQ